MSDKAAAVAVSVALPTLAKGVGDFLQALTGKPVAFVLVVATDQATQYVSNAARADGVELLTDLLERWKAGRADIPAHYNPDLKFKETPP